MAKRERHLGKSNLSGCSEGEKRGYSKNCNAGCSHWGNDAPFMLTAGENTMLSGKIIVVMERGKNLVYNCAVLVVFISI